MGKVITRNNKGETTKVQDLESQIEALKAEQKILKAAKRNEFRLQVSQKGALSVYGLGRFPVTLYKEQWIKLLGHTSEIAQFIQDNEKELATK